MTPLADNEQLLLLSKSKNSGIQTNITRKQICTKIGLMDAPVYNEHLYC